MKQKQADTETGGKFGGLSKLNVLQNADHDTWHTEGTW